MIYFVLFVVFVAWVVFKLHLDRLRQDRAWARKMERKVAKLRYEKYLANRPYGPYGSVKYLEDK